MKKCNYCKSEIDKSAKICPHCTKKQTKVSKVIIALLAVVIISVTMSTGDTDGTIVTDATTSSEKLELLDGHEGYVDSSYSYEITGTVQNNTLKEYSYVQISFYLYDSEGILLDTAIANNSGLEGEGKWKFTATSFFSNSNASDVASYKVKEITGW